MHGKQADDSSLVDVFDALNRHSLKHMSDADFIKKVCHYFNQIKTDSLTEQKKIILFLLATEAGIPHYYNILHKQFHQDIQFEDLRMLEISNYYNNLKLYTAEDVMLHKPQKEIWNLFSKNKKNRYFLSASTSFGKTYLVYEILRKMRYNNILLIFPTIALLSENLEKIMKDSDYEFLRDYKIHTLSDVSEMGEKNIFIYTPERFLSFVDKYHSKIIFDFLFVDEIYKIDNDFIIDELIKENERDIAYRVSSTIALKDAKDVLLAGPYITVSNSRGHSSDSFYRFLQDNNIEYLNYNDYEVVEKQLVDVKKNHKICNIDNKIVDFSMLKERNKTNKYILIVNTLLSMQENCIVYCASKRWTRYYAQCLFDFLPDIQNRTPEFSIFLLHIKKEFSEDWIVYKALTKGIGIHNGLIPKYIQKEIIHFFNIGDLKILTTTTTITEGVNTSAKNIIVTLDKKDPKALKAFDAKNIAGRAGRFLYHYAGRVIVLQNNFISLLNEDDSILEHKCYDKLAYKSDIDLDYTKQDFLSEEDYIRKMQLDEMVVGIPALIIQQFKTVSKKDKVVLFDKIMHFSAEEMLQIENCILKLQYNSIDFDGFQLFLFSIVDIVTNKKLKELIVNTSQTKTEKIYSILVYMIYTYLQNGFHGEIQYYVEKKNLTYDEAIQKTADFVYNLLKYHLVKYLSVFNLIYKYRQSLVCKKSIDDIIGFDRLLAKLEYNAYTEKGKLASDYGVPEKVVRYIENINNEKISSKIMLDEYERSKLEDVLKII